MAARARSLASRFSSGVTAASTGETEVTGAAGCGAAGVSFATAFGAAG